MVQRPVEGRVEQTFVAQSLGSAVLDELGNDGMSCRGGGRRAFELYLNIIHRME
jgi:hypothetical protein